MLRNGLIAGAFAVLAVVAVAGWARKAASSSDPAATNYSQPTYAQPINTQPVNTQPAAPNYNPQPASYDAYGQPSYGTAAGSVPTSNSCVDVNGNPVSYRQAVYSPDRQYVSDRYVQSIHRPVVVRRTQYVERDRGYTYADREVVARHGRSTKKSVAIVVGSAAGGAAIGALAGGGKGAGIGALAGGAAGFIYDRLTHNR